MFIDLNVVGNQWYEYRLRSYTNQYVFAYRGAAGYPAHSSESPCLIRNLAQFLIELATGLVYQGRTPNPRETRSDVVRRVMPRMLLMCLVIASAAGDWAGVGPGLASAQDPGTSATIPATHWAFLRPVPHPVPALRSDKSQSAHPIDRFIGAKLEELGITPAPRADRRTLIRRATYDLLGLPPTRAEVEAFEEDRSCDAWERVVDRLLASPRHGERWARHWLDTARYADTKGYVYDDREDARYVHSHTYRDWVVRAINGDMPYDRFLKLQIAADQLAVDRADLAAMGFLTLGRRFLGVTHDIIDDRIDVLMRGMQGLTVACARCHDHKYDPVPTQDYYSLYGVFDSSTERLVPLRVAPAEQAQRLAAEVAFEEELARRVSRFEEAFARAREAVGERIRRRTTDYLVAQLTAHQLPSEEFYEILDADQVNPVFVRRWQAYLRAAGRSFHPIFAPWHAFAALSEGEFATQAPAAWARLKELHGADLNPLVTAAFDRAPPRSMKDVALRYGTLFAGALEDGANAVDRPKEAFRVVLHGPDTPVLPPAGSLADTQFYFDEATRVSLGKLSKEIEVWHVTGPGATPYAGILEDLPTPRTPRVFQRGNPSNRGVEVPRQYVAVVAGPNRRAFEKGSGRLEMAELVGSRGNPLTARVLVNRVWLHHFGAGIVRTPSDFGTRCDPPSHPELLDYLAIWFMDHGWSVKQLHRFILLSETYQRSSEPMAGMAPASGDARVMDPENRLLARQNRHRLDFEATRDSLLAASGDLDLTMGGRAEPMFSEPYSRRRSIYGHIDRVVLPGTLRAFDFANPDLHCPQRDQTTVPQQALYLMNSGFVIERAQSMAARVESLAAEKGIEALYAAAFQRAPTIGELQRALAFVEGIRRHPPPPPAPRPSSWTCGYGAFDGTHLTSFASLPYFTNGAWQGGPVWPDPKLGRLRLTAAGGDPGLVPAQAAVRRWTAPFDCAVRVEGRITHEAMEGDGVRAAVLLPSRGIIAHWMVHHQTIDAAVEGLELKRGEWIDFVVDARATPEHDHFQWAPVVRLQATEASGAESVQWSAEQEFSGPPGLPARPLDAWSALAQVLLLSNEFVFVD